MRTRNLSFPLEETFPGIFLLQGWLGGILAGYVTLLSICLANSTVDFFAALVLAPYLFVIGSILAVVKATMIWTVYRLTRLQLGAGARVGSSAIGVTLIGVFTAYQFEFKGETYFVWISTMLLAALPVALLVGSRVKPWELFTFGSIDVGIGRSESRSVLGILGTLPLRFLSILGLAVGVLFVVCGFRKAWSFDSILWLSLPTAYLLFSAYVTFKSPHQVILLITGVAANIPVALAALWTFEVYSKWESTESLYAFLIFAAFAIAWFVFLVARLSVSTNNVVIPGSILSSPSLPRDNRHFGPSVSRFKIYRVAGASR